MAKVIHKYQLEIGKDTIFETPHGTRALHVDVQDNIPYVWVLKPVRKEGEGMGYGLLGFRIIMTGEEIPDNGSDDYVGTFTLREGVWGDFVGHVFTIWNGV